MKAKQSMGKIRVRFGTATSASLILAALLPAGAACAAEAGKEADTAVTDLTQPVSTVEVGVGNVNKDSAKFGEYNGLNKKGPFLILNFDAYGGAYGSDTDPTRWRVTGNDIGLDTRSLAAEYSEQGRFRVNLGFDQIERNRSDTYQTPYSGNGGNFTLPANWLPPRVPQVNATGINFRSFLPGTGLANALVNGASVAPTAAQIAQVNNIIAADVPAFHLSELHTRRERYEGGVTYNFTPQWELKASFRHEDKTGAKPMSTVSSQVSEFAATLADPINQTTEQYNMSLQYTGDKGYLVAAYNGSLFKNHINSLTWQDVNDLTKSATMSSAPDNQYHQLSLTGGWKFSPLTKLVVSGAYARSTQNEAFVTAAQNNQLPLGVPTPSLDGLVISKIFNAKLTSRPFKALGLTAAYKFDERDNRTPVNTYFFQDANEARAATPSPFNATLGLAPNTLASNINIYNNRPYSKKTNQLNLDADYRIAMGQSIKVGYDWQKIDRYCPGSWIDCADAATSKENTVRADWHANIVEDFSVRLGYAYSQRRVGNYNENAFLALVPMANFIGVGGAATNGTTVATQSALAYMIANGITGYGPLAGLAAPYTGNALIYGNNGGIIPQALYGSRNNINELPGMRRYNMADRNRDKLRTSLNWDATESLSLQAGVDFNKDDYANSVYGLRNAKSWAFNADASMALGAKFNSSLYFTHEDQKSQSAGDAYGANSTTANVNGFTAISPAVCYATIAARNLNGKQDPCLNWDANNRDKIDTLGLTLKRPGLMAGKLDIAGDLSYSRARTDVLVNGGSYANNPFAITGAAAGTVAAFYIPASALPTVTTKTTGFKLAGQYAIDKASSVRVSYLIQRMRSNDYIYAGMQFGTGTNYLPTLEQAPNYTVQVVGVSYQIAFR